MISIIAGQEFLPTDSVTQNDFWPYFAIPIIVGAVSLIVLVFAIRTKESSGGYTLSFSGLILAFLMLIISSGDTLDYSQNRDNLKTNIKSIYDVDEVVYWESVIESGAKLNVEKDGRIYEVILHVDPETYKPTLSPTATTAATAEDIESLKK